MALITISGLSFPTDNLADGDSYVVRFFYNQGFLDSTGQFVASGTLTSGTQIRVPVTVSGDFGTADPFTLYSTLDAQTPYPQSILIGCQLFKGNTALPIFPFNQSACPSMWILPSDLGASISFEEWALQNQRIVLTNPPETFYTASEVDALIAAAESQTAVNQDYIIGDYASFAAAITAVTVTGGTLVINEATTCTTNTSVPATITLRFTRKGSLTISTGITCTIAGPIDADPVKVFFNATAGLGSVVFSQVSRIHPDWWGFSTSASAATNNACLVAAETALPGSTATGGGYIALQDGVYDITGWSPFRKNISVQGAGKFATTLRGSGAGAYAVRMTDQARYQFADLSISGGGVKTFGFQIGPGNASGGTFINVRFEGGVGTSQGLLIGDTAGGPDISEVDFFNCDVALGDSGTGGALKFRGNNTINVSFFGGRISTGNATDSTAVAIDISDGGGITLYQTNLLALSDGVEGYAIEAYSGTVKMFGGHCEARGLIRTSVTDPRTDATTPPHVLVGISGATAATPALSVYHQAQRTLVLQWSRFGGDVRIGNGATMVLESVTTASGSIIRDVGSTVYGFTGGDIQANSIVQKQAGTAVTGLQLLNSNTTNGRYTEIETQLGESDSSFKSAIRFAKQATGANFGSKIQFFTELDDPLQFYAERFGINKDGQGVFTRSLLTGAPATLATTTPLDLGATLKTSNVLNYTPTQDSTLNLATVPSSQNFVLIITTSGATSYNITFGTNFKSTGVLATGVTTAKVFVLEFQCNGTIAAEMSRTVAM